MTMTDERRRPSQIMRGLGIRQAGDPVLGEATLPFELPHEAELANRIAGELIDKAAIVSMAHTFRDGMGLAAPQLGIGRSVAIVRPAGAMPLVLFNPRVIDASGETIEGYERCLSCFDVRGIVSRPKLIEVEHLALDGARRITSFRLGMARLVAHEIDHLNGILYDQRMDPDVQPIPVDEHRRLAGRDR